MRPLLLAALMLVGLALAGCAAKPDNARHIDIAVKRYDYTPGTGAPLNVTQGETVVLSLHSSDVTHGFAITEYGIQTEVPPGKTVEVRFTASHAGDFTIYCTVFCGTGHPGHKGVLHVA